MFGYVTVNRETLSPESEARFRAYYCGLCKALRKRHGLTGALTLSNDMTFLAIVLASLYEPDERAGRERCLNHPFRKHDYVLVEPTDYAADMNVMLAYQLSMDNWRDERRLFSLGEAQLVRRGYARVRKRYPEKDQFMRERIERLTEIEKRGPDGDIDLPTNIVGELIGDLFRYRADEWGDTLCAMGAALGRFIYLMDAYDDLPRDIKTGSYNPLKPISHQADFEDRCRDMLTMHIAECAELFELMPMLRDAALIRNVIYSGVWTKYAYIQSRKEKDQKK
ncbi:MAG: DUF5685 family protein [Christensenellales bacterium]|jgi:hypothetical protein